MAQRRTHGAVGCRRVACQVLNQILHISRRNARWNRVPRLGANSLAEHQEVMQTDGNIVLLRLSLTVSGTQPGKRHCDHIVRSAGKIRTPVHKAQYTWLQGLEGVDHRIAKCRRIISRGRLG